MFSNLFGKKEESGKDHLFQHRAYMTIEAKLKACVELAKGDEAIIFIAWFRETANRFSVYFIERGLSENRVFEADGFDPSALIAHQPVFVEHHPLLIKETGFVKDWGLKNIPVYSAMDEPLFKHFGSEKIIPMMKMMGMKENELIKHALVSKSIINGQQKIQEQVVSEQPASSQGEWMQRNLNN